MTDDFGWVGGAVCLDFANTVDDWRTGAGDRLESYDDLLIWSGAAGTMTSDEASRLRRRARKTPGEADRAFDQALALRRTIAHVFASISAARPPDGSDLEDLNGAISRVAGDRRIQVAGDAMDWVWTPSQALASVLRPIVWSAGSLLTGGEMPRVRECGGEGCTWLFVDRSRARTRRWCDMKTCGNRQKARRHYHRTRDDAR